jgi:hypothetical protein
LPQVLHHCIDQLLFIVSFGHPNRIRAEDLVLRPIRQFDLLDASSKGSHVVEVQSNPANKVVKVALGKTEFDSLIVVRSDFEAVYHFEHEEEGRRRTIGLFILFLCQLPIGHDIPYDLPFIDWRFLQLLILEINYFEETEHLRSNTFRVDSKLVDDSLLDICEGVVGLDSNEDAVADG